MSLVDRKLPDWLSWRLLKLSMKFFAFRLWLKGMSWQEANESVAIQVKLYMHKHIAPQFGPDKKP